MQNEQAAFAAGTGVRAWTFLGCHPETVGGQSGHRFRVWAPNARQVCLMGAFNDWDPDSHPMFPVGEGIWERFQTGLSQYDRYKYAVHTKDKRVLAKADPCAFYAELRPDTASRVYDLSGFQWEDEAWMAWRRAHPVYHSPLNVYQLHLGTWQTGEGNTFLNYRELAHRLVPYVKEMGYTHVELLPLAEYPFDGSWGYQGTGFFAPTSRFGTPHDFMYLINELHRAGVGVLLNWVPTQFSADAFGLYAFDGTPTYEHHDPLRGICPDGSARIFDYGKPEVRSFLLSCALFWLEQYHLDGLQIDALASMLYLDYGREKGEWTPNAQGGREHLEAVSFLRQLNETILDRHPDVLMLAEESTSWPAATTPVRKGGLGFNLKWNTGWIRDIQRFIHHRAERPAPLQYAFSKHFVLPLSCQETDLLKQSISGDRREWRSGVRALLTYMMTRPGKKLHFMGSELGKTDMWLAKHGLDRSDADASLQAFFKTLNALYLDSPPLWELDFSPEGFEWLHTAPHPDSVLSFLRKDRQGGHLLVLCNFSPVFRVGCRMGVPQAGHYREVFNSDDKAFGGWGRTNPGLLSTVALPRHGQAQHISLDLPPMGAVILRPC